MHEFGTQYRLSDGRLTFSQEEWLSDVKAEAWAEGAAAAQMHLDNSPSGTMPRNPYIVKEKQNEAI